MKKDKLSADNASPQLIEQVIQMVRGQRVILDSDLARLYGVTTSALNQAVRRNAARFPDDFAFPMTKREFADLKSQFVISNAGCGGRRKLAWRPCMTYFTHGPFQVAQS